MAINIRQKGATGERQVADALNLIANRVLSKHGRPLPLKPLVQRNQNQSAVGGSDLTNPFGLCIEVKRQENLSINTWWKQCLQAKLEFGGLPILIFKQNREKWRVIMMLHCPIVDAPYRAEMNWEDFQDWAERYLTINFLKGAWDNVA